MKLLLHKHLGNPKVLELRAKLKFLWEEKKRWLSNLQACTQLKMEIAANK